MSLPATEKQAFHELAEDYEATVDQELRKAWGISYSQFVALVLAFAKIPAEDHVLDLATGTGLIPRRLSAECDLRGQLVGVDITWRSVEQAKQMAKAEYSGTTIPFICASALALPFRRDSFDCVICALATHHMDWDVFLEQAAYVLKPGGKLILADVAASPFWAFPGIKACLRLAAYLYFFFTVSPARAWIESGAVSSVHTLAEWKYALQEHNFSLLQVRQLGTRNRWIPSAFLISGIKTPADG